MSNESERLMFWISRDARHGDRHGRSMAASLGAGQDIFGRHSGDGLSGTQGRTASAYRACAQAIWRCPPRVGRHRRVARDIERMTRLVRPYRKDGIAVEPAPRAPNHGFTRRLTATDAAVLAEMMSVWHPGFHANNGSEYILYQVARLRETLRAEFITSRPQHSNDTAR
jgi:hypothetical protein